MFSFKDIKLTLLVTGKWKGKHRDVLCPLVPTHARLAVLTIDIPIRDRHLLQVLEHQRQHLESVADGRVHSSDCRLSVVLCVWRNVERWNSL